MSDQPVIFKRNKTKQQPIQRARSTDDDKPDQADVESQGPMNLATKVKKRTKLKSKLSFGADDDGEGEGDIFKIKKSKLSKKLALGQHPALSALPVHLGQVSISSNAPTYSAADLNDLKASTPKRAPVYSAININTDQFHDVDVSTDYDNLSALPTGDGDDVASTLAIPTQAYIAESKERREKLRGEPSISEDFISLDMTRSVGADIPKGPHPNSRLVREEDEVGEGDDEFSEYTSAQDRIALGKKSRKAEAAKRKDAMKELIEDAEMEAGDGGDVDMEWEMEQLRRGGHTGTQTSVKEANNVYKPAPVPAATPVPSISPALLRLQTATTQVTASHEKNMAAINLTAEEREKLEVREQELRELVEAEEIKRAWFASFKDWIEGIATFLDEKYPQLEKLEECHLLLLKEKQEIIKKRRKMDDEDGLTAIYGAAPAPVPVNQADGLDHLPQPVATKGDRSLKRIARQQRRIQNKNQLEDGFSTDSSLSPSESRDYDIALETLMKDKQEILSDVQVNEFRDPSDGLGKWFAEWRRRFPDIYVGAWGSLGMIGAWEFWARLECLGWDFVHNIRSLDSFDWYLELHSYSDSIPEDGTTKADGDLTVAMISTAVVPRFCKLIEAGVFDPLSTKDLRRILDVAEEVEASLTKGHDKHQMLVASVYKVFEQTALYDEETLSVYLNLLHAPFDPESRPARKRFLNRRIKFLQNLLRWRKYTGELFGAQKMCIRLIEKVILPVARSGWDVGGKECIQKIVSFLPPEMNSSSLSSML